METAASAAEPATDEAHELERELARVIASPLFAGAQAHQRLLRYLVEHARAGRATLLKETVLGIEVFQRPAQSFDPRRDSIVRVEARRLRERLRQHYAMQPPEGWMIELPKGSYRPRLVRRSARPVAGNPSELVERGQYFLRLGHEEGHRKALQRFESAAQVAPSLAAAHAGIARAWMQLVATNLEPPRPGVDTALAAVRHALQLEPGHAESLVLAAALSHRFAFDWAAARLLFQRALQAAPLSPYVRHSLALSLMMRGEFDAAAAELAVAHGLDPLHLGLRAHMALLALYRRDWDAAEAGLRGLLDMSADNVLGMSLLAYVSLCRGQAQNALAQYEAVARRHPQLSIGRAGVVWAQADLAQQVRARQSLQALVQGWTGRYLSPYQLAMAEWRLGASGHALALLERAVHERDPNALCLPVDPAFDGLHGLPRFEALRQQVLGGDSPAG